jgi:hypothetical protein
MNLGITSKVKQPAFHSHLSYFPNGVVVQLVRTPACHVGGRGFESRPLRILKRYIQKRPRNSGDVFFMSCCKTAPKIPIADHSHRNLFPCILRSILSQFMSYLCTAG